MGKMPLPREPVKRFFRFRTRVDTSDQTALFECLHAIDNKYLRVHNQSRCLTSGMSGGQVPHRPPSPHSQQSLGGPLGPPISRSAPIAARAATVGTRRNETGTLAVSALVLFRIDSPDRDGVQCTLSKDEKFGYRESFVRSAAELGPVRDKYPAQARGQVARERTSVARPSSRPVGVVEEASASGRGVCYWTLYGSAARPPGRVPCSAA